MTLSFPWLDLLGSDGGEMKMAKRGKKSEKNKNDIDSGSRAAEIGSDSRAENEMRADEGALVALPWNINHPAGAWRRHSDATRSPPPREAHLLAGAHGERKEGSEGRRGEAENRTRNTSGRQRRAGRVWGLILGRRGGQAGFCFCCFPPHSPILLFFGFFF